MAPYGPISIPSLGIYQGLPLLKGEGSGTVVLSPYNIHVSAVHVTSPKMCDNSGDNGLAHRELLCPKDVSHLTKVGVCVIPILGVDPQAWSQSAMGCVVLTSTGPSPSSPLWTTKWYTELSAVSLPESILFWPPSTTGTQSLEEHGCSCHCRKPHLNPPWVAHTSNLKCFVGSITCSD